MKKFITATDARKQLYDIIKEVQTPGFFVTLTHGGIPEAVVLSFDEFEGLMETLEIMSDPVLDKEVRAAIKEVRSGKRPSDTISLEEAKKKLKI